MTLYAVPLTLAVTKDHDTWGDCARAARIQVDRAALAAGRLDTKRAAQ